VELLEDAKRMLGGLQRSGLQPHDKVILHIESLRDYFTAFWACVLGGIVPVTISVAPSYGESNGVLNKLHNTWELLGRPIVLTSESLLSAVQGLAGLLGMEGLVARSVGQLRQPSAGHIHVPRPDDLMFLQLTSGSTGMPKCVRETHWGAICDISSYGQAQASTPDDVTLNWFPMDHVLPLMYHHIKSAYLGCCQIHVKTDAILSNPLRWLDLIEEHRVTHTWSPNFGLKLLNEHLTRSPRKSWDLSSLRCLLTAGEQVTLTVIRELLGHLKPCGVPEPAIQPAYGMTECSMTYQNEFDLACGANTFRKESLAGRLVPAEHDNPATHTFIHVGRPQAGVCIRIVDAEHQLVPEGFIGRIQARRDVPPRYYPDQSISPGIPVRRRAGSTRATAASSFAGA
jgi:acyl-CoA synthetase (AMP-forming)/AMP-acid ligase II